MCGEALKIMMIIESSSCSDFAVRVRAPRAFAEEEEDYVRLLTANPQSQ